MTRVTEYVNGHSWMSSNRNYFLRLRVSTESSSMLNRRLQHSCTIYFKKKYIGHIYRPIVQVRKFSIAVTPTEFFYVGPQLKISKLIRLPSTQDLSVSLRLSVIHFIYLFVYLTSKSFLEHSFFSLMKGSKRWKLFVVRFTTNWKKQQHCHVTDFFSNK